MNETKTMRENIETGAKYSGSSVALAFALTGIIVFFQPTWEPIKEHILGLLTFVLNLGMIYLVKR